MKSLLSRSNCGFTLIEIALAISACAIILLAVYGVFSRAVHLRDNAQERVRTGQLISRAAKLIRRDLNGAWISVSDAELPANLAATLKGSAQSNSSSFPGYLRFCTTSGRDDASGVPMPDVQEVEYYVASDPENPQSGAGRLVRTVGRTLLAQVRQTPVEEPILNGIGAMEVSFLEGEEWKDSWDFEQSQTVPEAIRVIVRKEQVNSQTATPLVEVIVPWTTTPRTL